MTKTTVTTILVAASLLYASSPSLALETRLIPAPEAGWLNFMISDDGSVMAVNNGGRIYLWTAGEGFTFLGAGYAGSSSIGLSGDGTRVTATLLNDRQEPVPAIWTREGDWFEVPLPDGNCVMDGSRGSAWAIANDGTMAGLSWYCPGAEAFTWQAGAGSVLLDRDSGISHTRPDDVSNDGRLFVGYATHPDQGYRRPAYWDRKGDLHLFLGNMTEGTATGCSSDGSLIVGAGEGRAFFHDVTTGNTRSVGPLDPTEPIQSVRFNAVSDDTLAVGWNFDQAFGQYQAVVWTPGAGLLPVENWIRELGGEVPEGIHLESALHVAADGSLVGCSYVATTGTGERGILLADLDGFAGGNDPPLAASRSSAPPSAQSGGGVFHGGRSGKAGVEKPPR